jgi:organic hydroperoxide reductase OsmC/OhrA
MSRTVAIRFANAPGTQAGLGLCGTRTLVADRPAGVAGGMGLGFNGGELFAAALGGCFWNDLHYAAERLGHRVASAEVNASVTLAGTPLRAVRAHLDVRLAVEPAGAAAAVFDAACADSTIANSVMAAVPVTFTLEGDRR